jgi:hypothetical protein
VGMGLRECLRWFNRTNYENAKRKNPNVDKERYYTNHTLKISRLPGLEDLTDCLYIGRIEEFVGEKREKLLVERRSKGLGFLGEKSLRLQKAGVKPRSTKNLNAGVVQPLSAIPLSPKSAKGAKNLPNHCRLLQSGVTKI